jgi:ribosome-binding factor A
MTKKRRGSPLSGSAKPVRGSGQRQLRVGEELRHALSKILREGQCRDPALQDVSITVTEVTIGPDLRNATAFVMPLAGANAVEIIAALKRCAPFLKGLLAREVALRNTPNLGFALDRSFEQAERISALLARPEVARDLQPQIAETGESRDEC